MRKLKCHRMRGLVAAAAVDALAPDERGRLDAHLRECAACRTEVAALITFVASIPQERPELGVDLGPALRSRLRYDARPETPRLRPRLTWTLATMSVILLAGVGGWRWYMPAAPASNVASREQGPAVAEALQLAAACDAKRDYAGCYEILKRAVDASPSDPRAGEAQMRLADVAYSKLHWYDRADQEYRRLVADYQDTVRASEDWGIVIVRRDLLAEARRDNYAALHELDKARQNPATAFEGFEKIIARDSTSEVANQAMNDMLALVASDSPADDPLDRLKTLQAARERCTDDRAKGRLDFEIGDLAYRKLRNDELASDAYKRASESPDQRLAQRARESMVAMRAGQR